MMSQSTTDYFYAVTPCVLWPILWVQIFLMNRKIAALKAAAGGEIITYSVAIRRNGTLYLRWLSDNARGIRPIDEWRPDYNIISNTLDPHLRRMPESLRRIINRMRCDFPEQAQAQAQGCVARRISLGEDALYLDPG